MQNRELCWCCRKKVAARGLYESSSSDTCKLTVFFNAFLDSFLGVQVLRLEPVDGVSPGPLASMLSGKKSTCLSVRIEGRWWTLSGEHEGSFLICRGHTLDRSQDTQ